VRQVGERLSRAADDPEIRKMLGIRPDLKLEWEFTVVHSKQVNAFCLPGGKVVVYTGILPVCRTYAGLAVVMGHEIGHALARHGAERMAQQEMVTVGEIAVASSLGNMDFRKRAMVLGALGAGASVGVLLPFSRHQESEADHIGIILMAAAGYDPSEASRFWVRMSEKTGSGGTAFLSTHPSHETRSRDLQKWSSSDAMSVYNSFPHASNPDRLILESSPGLVAPTKKPKERPALKGDGWEIK
jgi:predicted Zn-dependent protease